MTDSRGCEHEGTKVETASNRLNGVADPEGATILRLCLKKHFAIEMRTDKFIAGRPGESILRHILYLHSGITEIIYDSILDSLRRLCRLAAVSNILSNHGISFARGNTLKVSYRYGELFELEEFSAKHLASKFVKKRNHKKVPTENQ